MIDKIRAYIDHAFLNTADTKKLRDLKEELLANLVEKYNDQIRAGKSESEAYNNAVRSIGDISELIESVKETNPLRQPTKEERQKYALLTSIAVMMYILSPMMLIFFDTFLMMDEMGLIVMFGMIAVATGIIIYANMTKPKYNREDDSVVEEFKEWRNQTSRQRSAWKAFQSAFWSLTTAVYLLVSFIFGIWGFSWIIFIVAGALEELIKGFVYLKNDKGDIYED